MPTLSCAEQVDVVMITALLEERQAMQTCFGIPFETQLRGGIPYSVGVLGWGDHTIRIAAVQPVDSGPIPAAVLATRAVLDWRPACIIMTGICAGVEGFTRLGDLVVASQVFDHMSGTYRDGQLIPFQRSVSQEPWVLQFINSLRDNEDFLQQVWNSHPRPCATSEDQTLHIGTMASGSFVVKDGAYLKLLLKRTSKLLALDMEAFGVASATVMCSTAFTTTNWLVVKGVVDYADANKNDNWHGYASFTSARFVHALLTLLLQRDKAYQWFVSHRSRNSSSSTSPG